MAIKFIKSIDIDVFPAVHRATDYAISKRTTEDNLTKFGKLSGNKANLSQMFKDPDNPLYVIFNIAGYWFRCLEANIPEGSSLNAYIKLTYDKNIGYMLTPIDVGGGTLLDVKDAGDEYFKGLAFDTKIPSTAGALYYGCKVRDAGGSLIYQTLKLDASEIRNTADDTKHIGEEFDTGTLTAQTINGLTIEATGNLTVAGKTTINSTTDSTSSATGALVLAGGAAIAKKLYVGTDLDVNGKTTLDSTNIDVETAGKFDIVNGATVIESTNKDNKSLNVPIITDVTIQNGASGASTFKVAKTAGVEVGTNAIAKTTKLYGDTTAYHGTTQAFKVDVDSGVEVGTSTSAKTTKLYGDTTIYNASSAVINVDVDATSGTAGLTIAKTTAITDTSDATNAESGALRVSGGVGIAKNLFVDGNTTLGDTATADTTTINGVTTINGHTSANTKTLVIKNGNNEKFSVDSDGDVLATTYNSLTLTAEGSGFSVSGGTASKKLTLSGDTTLATNALTLKSGKALTMQYAGLTVGEASRTGNITLKSSDETGRSLTLTGSPSLSGIKTTGSGTLALNKNLTINDANKTLAGAATDLTFAGNFTTTGAYTTTLAQGANVTLTLPTTSQTLATIAGTENLTGKTVNGLTIDTTTGILDIANSKTLAVNESITLNADQARALTINGSNKTLAGNGSTLTLGNTLTTGAHATTLTTKGSTSITLPTTGTLATIAGTENLTNKTINGLTLTQDNGGIALGSNSVVASNPYAIVIGRGSSSESDDSADAEGASIVIGGNSNSGVDGKNIIIGSKARSADYSNIVIGNNVYAEQNSLIIGHDNNLYSTNAIVIGHGAAAAVANDDNHVQLGNSSFTSGNIGNKPIDLQGDIQTYNFLPGVEADISLYDMFYSKPVGTIALFFFNGFLNDPANGEFRFMQGTTPITSFYVSGTTSNARFTCKAIKISDTQLQIYAFSSDGLSASGTFSIKYNNFYQRMTLDPNAAKIQYKISYLYEDESATLRVKFI